MNLTLIVLYSFEELGTLLGIAPQKVLFHLQPKILFTIWLRLGVLYNVKTFPFSIFFQLEYFSSVFSYLSMERDDCTNFYLRSGCLPILCFTYSSICSKVAHVCAIALISFHQKEINWIFWLKGTNLLTFLLLYQHPLKTRGEKAFSWFWLNMYKLWNKSDCNSLP